MIRLLLIALSLPFFLICNAFGQENNNPDNPDTTIVFKKFPVESKIIFENFIKHSQPYARCVFLTDTSILLTNEKKLTGDYFFYEYSLQTKNLTGKYIKGGTKKGMTIGPLSFGLYKKKKLFVRDISLKKVIIASLADKYSFDSIATEDYASPQFAYSVQLMDSDRILKSGIGIIKSGTENDIRETLQITGLKNDTPVRLLGKLPPTPDNIPLSSWKHANLGYLFLNPDENKAAFACKYSDMLQIVDIKTGRGINIKGPENFDPEFIPIKAGNNYLSQTTEKTIYAFTNGAVTGRYIYLLYNGNKEDDEHHTDGKYIYVYDWNGSPVKKIQLDRYITGFAITDDDSVIYAFDEAGQCIVRSKLIK
jgi:hypothetical protein